MRWPVFGALLAALGWSLTTAAAALAISAPIHIHGTSGEGVFIRTGPSTSNPVVGWMPEGASPDYNCFAWGQNINGVPIWFNVNYGGVTGFYASFYDDSSYHSNEELTAKYGVPLCGSAPPAPAPSPAPAPVPAPGGPSPGSGPVYTIVDADGGVYFRSSPKWSDTPATPGMGVYTGDQVQLICGASGEPYGPYSNHWWSYVQNLSRPGAGKGWVNAHFINDGMPANQPSPGETGCPSSIPGAPGSSGAPATPPSGPKSVFYWPQLGAGDWPRQPPFEAPADVNVGFSDWDTGGSCRPDPHHFNLPGSVNTLAGWSGSRIAPLYFLAANQTRWSQIHTIILFDPGSYDEMYAGGKGCDKRLSPSVNSILAHWLESSQNRLLVLTGQVSEEKHELLGIRWGKAQFAGLWNFYFHDLWPKSADVRSRAIVCDYDYLRHEEVIEDFWQIVKAAAGGYGRDSCPVSLQAPDPTRWSP